MDDNSLDRVYQDNSVMMVKKLVGYLTIFLHGRTINHQGKHLWKMPKSTLVIDME